MARDLGFKTTSSETFYFLSYNAEDATRVSSYALKMYDAGLPLWYDNGINYGEQWEETISERIDAARAMIFFFSVGMLAKADSYAIKEYRIAKKMEKDIYIILVDKLDKELWRLYPKKGSFLDDIDQTHFPDDIQMLIDRLKKDENITHDDGERDASTIRLCVEGAKIFDSEYLLNNNFFTAYEISKKHVDLDYLTVDGRMFPEALEVEGDAETWEGMITDTADCSANLIINNNIVGYMDFLPVTPEDYEKLKTEPFNDSYVAFYAFGGRFDIFGSMFSIDPNYVTQNNILLFTKWMINRILEWKKNNIHIGKIELSIYSKYQAKALESLGFKLALKNQLKGMLYEIKVSDLFKNRLIQSQFKVGQLTTYTYSVYDNSNADIVNQCLEIASSLSVENGGTLQYLSAPKESNVIIAAEYLDEVSGYLCLKEYDVFKGSIYVEQIGIKEYHQRLGIGQELIRLAINYAKERGYNAIYLNCKKTNIASFSAFSKAGFIPYDMSKEEYLDIGISEDDIEKNCALMLKING